MDQSIGSKKILVSSGIFIALILLFFAFFYLFVGPSFTTLLSSPDLGIGIFFIMLFLIVVGLPLIFSIVYSKKSDLNKNTARGKGLIHGTLISLAINGVTLLYFSRGDIGFGVFLFLFLGLISIVYLVIGLIFYYVGRTKQSSK